MASHLLPRWGLHPQAPDTERKNTEMYRNRSHQVSFRLSDEEYTLLQYRLSQSKMSKTNFFVFAIRNQRIVVVNDYIQILAELKRHGSNINQIAYRLNRYSHVPDNEIINTLRDCRACYAKLFDLADLISNVGE